MITVTDVAKAKIKALLTKRGKGVGLRVGVRTTGCSGMAYVLEYLDSIDYEIGAVDYAFNDFTIRVSQKDDVYISGMEIDHVRNGLNEGFQFNNPNERDRCGCGESFRV